MNRERRREALAKFLRVVKSDIDRETKGMGGVENLAKALQETPKFGGEESQQDVQEKLQHMRSNVLCSRFTHEYQTHPKLESFSLIIGER